MILHPHVGELETGSFEVMLVVDEYHLRQLEIIILALFDALTLLILQLEQRSVQTYQIVIIQID